MNLYIWWVLLFVMVVSVDLAREWVSNVQSPKSKVGRGK